MDLNVSSSRIAIVVPRQSFVYRGVGAYCKSIIDFALANNVAVDIISDDAVRDNGMFDAYAGKVNWYIPESIYNDKVYKQLSTFNKPYDTALVLNLRNAMIRAAANHSYDCIITNTGEALDAITGIGLHTVTRVGHATHHESEASVEICSDIFTRGVSDRYAALCKLPGITLLCQSNWVVNKLILRGIDAKNCVMAQPLLTEAELANFDSLPATGWGVGFIGPYEPRKAPDEFIRAVSQAKLPAVVLTPSEASAKKFKEKLTDAGVEHQVHVGLTGKAKVSVLRGLAAAYHPAQSETFGLGVYETAHCCPTIVLKEREWSNVHADYAQVVDKDAVVTTLQQCYNQKHMVNQAALIKTHQRAAKTWQQLFVADKNKKPTKNNFYTELDSKQIIKHSDFAAIAKSFCTDEIHKLMRLPTVEGIETLHTTSDTYYRYQGSVVEIPQTDNTNALFSFE